MKFFGIAAFLALGAFAMAAPSDPTTSAAPDAVSSVLPSPDDISADPEVAAAIESAATEATLMASKGKGKGEKKSSCARCDIYCAAGAGGPDRRTVQIMCATCIAVELITNKGKRC